MCRGTQGFYCKWCNGKGIRPHPLLWVWRYIHAMAMPSVSRSHGSTSVLWKGWDSIGGWELTGDLIREKMENSNSKTGITRLLCQFYDWERHLRKLLVTPFHTSDQPPFLMFHSAPSLQPTSPAWFPPTPISGAVFLPLSTWHYKHSTYTYYILDYCLGHSCLKPLSFILQISFHCAL